MKNRLFEKFKRTFNKLKGDLDDDTVADFEDLFKDIEENENIRENDKLEEEKADDVESKEKDKEEVKSKSEEIGKEVNEEKENLEEVEKKEEPKEEENKVEEEPKTEENASEKIELDKLDDIVSKLVKKHLDETGLPPSGGKVESLGSSVNEFR